MGGATGFFSKDLQLWCELIVNTFHPEKVLFFGTEYEDAAKEFSRLNVESYGVETDGVTAQMTLKNSDKVGVENLDRATWDLFIISESAIVGRYDSIVRNMSQLLQASKKVLFVLFPNSPIDHPLPLVSKQLRALGYNRDFRVELWVADRVFTCVFEPYELSTDDLIHLQVAELWRLALVNQKRRLVMQEYMQDLVLAKYDLEVYHNSRTAKTIRTMQKIRRMLRNPFRHS